jgi:proteasome activator subunit 4
MGEAQDDDVKPTYRYPAGYFFKDPEDPLYITVHNLRDKVGEILHSVHVFLTSSQEDDVPCFNALYTVWLSVYYPESFPPLLTAVGIPVLVYGCWD